MSTHSVMFSWRNKKKKYLFGYPSYLEARAMKNIFAAYVKGSLVPDSIRNAALSIYNMGLS